MASMIQNYEIVTLPGGTTYLRLQLTKGAKVRVEPIALRAFSAGVTHYKQRRISEEEKQQRKLMGESTNYDYVDAKEDGWAILSREKPGTILAFECKYLFAATTAFFAAEAGVKVEPYEVKKEEIKQNSEAGKYWQKYTNPDKLKFFIGFDSGVIPITIQPGESVTVYHGYWLAMEGGLNMQAVEKDLVVTNQSQSPKMLFIRSCNFPF